MSDRVYTAEEIINEMRELGYWFHSGAHCEDLVGYFAQFKGPDYKPSFYATTWNDCGHGLTFLEAVEEALAMAVGVIRKPTPCKKFEKR